MVSHENLGTSGRQELAPSSVTATTLPPSPYPFLIQLNSAQQTTQSAAFSLTHIALLPDKNYLSFRISSIAQTGIITQMKYKFRHVSWGAVCCFSKVKPKEVLYHFPLVTFWTRTRFLLCAIVSVSRAANTHPEFFGVLFSLYVVCSSSDRTQHRENFLH